MMKNGGNLKPSSHWDWNLCGWAKEIDKNINYYSSELYEKRYSNLQMMLYPFIGVTGMLKVSEDRIKKIEDIFGLKTEKNKESSIISFASQKNNLKPTLFLSIILRFTKYKQVYNATNFKIFIFYSLKKEVL